VEFTVLKPEKYQIKNIVECSKFQRNLSFDIQDFCRGFVPVFKKLFYDFQLNFFNSVQVASQGKPFVRMYFFNENTQHTNTTPVVGFFIKVRTLVRTFSGHSVQQYIHKTGDREGAL
jgi:hypothetical protein